MMNARCPIPFTLFMLGLIMFFGCGKSNAPDDNAKPTDVVLHVPGMN